MKKALFYVICFLSVLFTTTACYYNEKPVVLSNDIKAVYLTPNSKGQLPMKELKNHAQILVVNDFDDMKTVIIEAENMIGIWIDMSAVDMVDKKWLLEKPQKFYPLLLIGCYDVVNPQPMRELFYSDRIDWSSKTVEKGFSYWVPLKVSDDSTSLQEYNEGIDSILSIDELLRVTDTLID
jgi:hypothetical protein